MRGRDRRRAKALRPLLCLRGRRRGRTRMIDDWCREGRRDRLLRAQVNDFLMQLLLLLAVAEPLKRDEVVQLLLRRELLHRHALLVERLRNHGDGGRFRVVALELDVVGESAAVLAGEHEGSAAVQIRRRVWIHFLNLRSAENLHGDPRENRIRGHEKQARHLLAQVLVEEDVVVALPHRSEHGEEVAVAERPDAKGEEADGGALLPLGGLVGALDHPADLLLVRDGTVRDEQDDRELAVAVQVAERIHGDLNRGQNIGQASRMDRREPRDGVGDILIREPLQLIATLPREPVCPVVEGAEREAVRRIHVRDRLDHGLLGVLDHRRHGATDVQKEHHASGHGALRHGAHGWRRDEDAEVPAGAFLVRLDEHLGSRGRLQGRVGPSRVGHDEVVLGAPLPAIEEQHCPAVPLVNGHHRVRLALPGADRQARVEHALDLQVRLRRSHGQVQGIPARIEDEVGQLLQANGEVSGLGQVGQRKPKGRRIVRRQVHIRSALSELALHRIQLRVLRRVLGGLAVHHHGLEERIVLHRRAARDGGSLVHQRQLKHQRLAGLLWEHILGEFHFVCHHCRRQVDLGNDIQLRDLRQTAVVSGFRAAERLAA
eukprot:scaffold2152_cov252-Pinguiococcus_pyrenoidosus.AAC.10